MKTVINLSIGGRAFTIDDDAYQKLDSYLSEFKSKIGSDWQSKEVMDEVEQRIAELFTETLGNGRQNVISLNIVNDVISRIGMPDGSAPSEVYTGASNVKATKKFYLDPDDKKIAGVCSGLAAYFDIDATILRILFVVAFFCGSAGFWAYIIFWIVAPKAVTAAQRCEMRGIPTTAENLRKYSSYKQ